MHLDIVYISKYIAKKYVSRKNKTSYNLKWKNSKHWKIIGFINGRCPKLNANNCNIESSQPENESNKLFETAF